MGILSFLGLGGDKAAKPIEAIGGILDNLFTSDEEKLDKQIIRERLAQHPHMAQIELNKITANHPSIFVAGWRSAIGWVSAIALFMFYVPQFSMASWMWVKLCLKAIEGGREILPAYPIDESGLMQLIIAMLGMGGLRTFEKFKGIDRKNLKA